MTKVNIMVNQRLSLKFVNISFVNKCLKRVQCRHWPVKQITLSLLNLDKGLLDSSAKSPYAGQTSFKMCSTFDLSFKHFKKNQKNLQKET